MGSSRPADTTRRGDVGSRSTPARANRAGEGGDGPMVAIIHGRAASRPSFRARRRRLPAQFGFRCRGGLRCRIASHQWAKRGMYMGCRVVLIRHGLTYWNVKKKMQGQVNIPLNEVGMQQAKALADGLKDYHFDICFASPLDRACMTAKLALGNRNTPIHKDLRLVEQGYGLLEGHSYKRWPWFRWTNEAYNYESHPERYRAAIGGETFDELYARAQDFIDNALIPEAKRREGILVAGHGAINGAIMGRLFGIPLEDFWSVRQANCGYTVLDEKEGSFSVAYSTPVELVS